MKIGIDLDNTIIDHRLSFKKAYCIKKKISFNSKISKNFIKENLRHIDWLDIQADVYSDLLTEYGRLYRGFSRFVRRSEIKKHTLQIVSHKTNFSFSKKKNLIIPAMKFIKEKVKIENIFFFETLNQKIKFINNQNYDFFIDDLTEVIEKLNLHNSKKFLFINNWNEIDNQINKNLSVKELISYLNKKFINKKLIFINKITTNNSNVFKIYDTKNKLYYKLKFSLRDKKRVYNEYSIIKLLNKSINFFSPKAIYFDKTYNFALYSWIDGVPTSKINNLFLDKVILFLLEINSKSFKEFYSANIKASASCFSIRDVFSQIDNRLNKLKKVKNINLFLLVQQIENFYKIKKEILFKDLSLKIINKKINTNELILSPSDLSVKNFISNKSNINFIDFEYMGLDDHIKLICDTILHPANNLNDSQVKFFFKLFNKNIIKINLIRFKKLFIFYAIVWCLIILNPFLLSKDSALLVSKLTQSRKLFNKIKNKYTTEYINELTKF